MLEDVFSDFDFYFSYPLIKCLSCLTFNVAWLVVGCVLYSGNISQYGTVVLHETVEWDKSPITDFMAVQQPKCPEGYEMVNGSFPGINNYCMSSLSYIFSKPLWGNGYSLGDCPKKSSGTTVRGLAPQILNKFDSNYFCVQRNKNFDYHQLSKMRS